MCNTHDGDQTLARVSVFHSFLEKSTTLYRAPGRWVYGWHRQETCDRKMRGTESALLSSLCRLYLHHFFFFFLHGHICSHCETLLPCRIKSSNFSSIKRDDIAPLLVHATERGSIRFNFGVFLEQYDPDFRSVTKLVYHFQLLGTYWRVLLGFLKSTVFQEE